MDIGRAFSFAQEDESWITKVLIGGLVSLIPVIGTITVTGWQVEIARNVARGEPKPLPGWDNFGEKIQIGFGAFVVALVSYIPVFILQCVVQGLAGVLASGSGDSGGASAAAAIVAIVGGLLLLVVGFASVPFILTGLIRYVQTGSIGAALQIGENITFIRNNVGALVQLFLVALLAGVVGGLGAIACGVGLIFTVPFSQAVIGHALGQTVAGLGGGQNYPATPPSYPPPPPPSF